MRKLVIIIAGLVLILASMLFSDSTLYNSTERLFFSESDYLRYARYMNAIDKSFIDGGYTMDFASGIGLFSISGALKARAFIPFLHVFYTGAQNLTYIEERQDADVGLTVTKYTSMGMETITTNTNTSGEIKKVYDKPGDIMHYFGGIAGFNIKKNKVSVAVNDYFRMYYDRDDYNFDKTDNEYLVNAQGFTNSGTNYWAELYRSDNYSDSSSTWTVPLNSYKDGLRQITAVDYKNNNIIYNKISLAAQFSFLKAYASADLIINNFYTNNYFYIKSESSISNRLSPAHSIDKLFIQSYECEGKTFTAISGNNASSTFAQEGGLNVDLIGGIDLNFVKTANFGASFGYTIYHFRDHNLTVSRKEFQEFQRGAEISNTIIAAKLHEFWKLEDTNYMPGWSSSQYYGILNTNFTFSSNVSMTRIYRGTPRNISAGLDIEKVVTIDDVEINIFPAYGFNYKKSEYRDDTTTESFYTGDISVIGVYTNINPYPQHTNHLTLNRTEHVVMTAYGDEIKYTGISHSISLPVAAKVTITEKVQIFAGAKVQFTFTSYKIEREKGQDVSKTEITLGSKNNPEQIAQEIITRRPITKLTETGKYYTITKSGGLGVRFLPRKNLALGVGFTVQNNGTVNVSTDVTKRF